MTDKQDIAVALHRIAMLEKQAEEDAREIEDLKQWKNTCTKWGAWWAGVCATVMTAATLIRTYWDEIVRFVGSQK